MGPLLTAECLSAAEGRPPAGVRSIRVLRDERLERILARAHPVTPIVWFGPVIAFGLLRGLSGRPGPVATPALFAGGWLVWTLAEYLLHRFLFHRPARTPAQRVRRFLMHGYHHDFPDDRMRLVAPPLMSWGPAAAFALAYYLALGPRLWAPALAGTAAGYVAYDWIHYYTHHFRPRGRIGRWLRRYHMLHHHRDGGARFGVSSPLWDLVFGTYLERPKRPSTSATSAGDSSSATAG